MLTAPRTDPYERHYRIRLLPWMMASKRNFTSRTPRNPWDTDFPALCRARVEFRNVLLGPRSSLHHLRRGQSLLFVRQLHRYYSAVRPLNGVHVRRAAYAFPDRSPIQRDTAEVSRFSCMLFLDVLGSLTTPGPAFARDCRCRRCCLPATAKGSAPECKVFEAQSPSPSMPLSTLRQPPRDGVHARLEVRMESLLLSCKALSSSTTCRFIPAHG